MTIHMHARIRWWFKLYLPFAAVGLFVHDWLSKRAFAVRFEDDESQS